MAVKTLTINGKLVSAKEGQAVLEAARDAGVEIPTLCHLEGASDVGACRLCMVEMAGSGKLLPACVLKVEEGMEVQTDTERLKKYRRMIVELLFAERNHVWALCVANHNCELQAMAERLGVDHNRCILCTRCVRVCAEVEGANTWDVAGRGTNARVITDMNQPWGEAVSCMACGKCVDACPTGAIFRQGVSVAEMKRDRRRVEMLVTAREKKQWNF